MVHFKNYKMRNHNSNKLKRQFIVIVFAYIGLVQFLTGCKKLVEVDAPPTSTSSVTAFNNDFTASAVLTGIYAQLSDRYFGGGLLSTSIITDLYVDNLMLYAPDDNSSNSVIFKNNLEPQYLVAGDAQYWRPTYNLLFTINDAISRLENNSDLNFVVRDRLNGEAHFLRAFCYFYLTNIYGEVPLVLNTDPEANSHISRASINEIYNQIESDLEIASQLLDNNYVASDVTVLTDQRTRPNLATVNALQARVYLYEKKYVLAESAASKTINQGETYSLLDVNSVFLKNSKETLWALQPVSSVWATREGSVFILPQTGPDGFTFPYYTSKSLNDEFEAGDNRKSNWLGSINVNSNIFYYPVKYKIQATGGSTNYEEYTVVFRLAEQYLIRAEARNEQGNTIGATEDLNTIRLRARSTISDDIPNPLPDISITLTQEQLRPIILKERRVELFTEGGHRFFDLKRTGTIDNVMLEAEEFKHGSWESFKSLFPVPTSDILLNSSLIQNTGYAN
jgi:starch-binding outer membrane protein, SusD/RagB family